MQLNYGGRTGWGALARLWEWNSSKVYVAVGILVVCVFVWWLIGAVAETSEEQARAACGVIRSTSKVPVTFKIPKYSGVYYCVLEVSPGVHIPVKVSQ